MLTKLFDKYVWFRATLFDLPFYSFADAAEQREIQIQDHEITSVYQHPERFIIEFNRNSHQCVIIVEKEMLKLPREKQFKTISNTQFAKKFGLNLFRGIKKIFQMLPRSWCWPWYFL